MSLDHLERYCQDSVRIARRGRLRVVPVKELERWIGERALTNAEWIRKAGGSIYAVLARTSVALERGRRIKHVFANAERDGVLDPSGSAGGCHSPVHRQLVTGP